MHMHTMTCTSHLLRNTIGATTPTVNVC